MPSPSVSEELIKFIAAESATDQKIGADTRLQKDLGVYGDDAIELLLAYSKAFSVDVSNFMAADHFDGEGIDFLALFKVKDKPKKSLTVLHLQRGIEAGRLDEGVINGPGSPCS